MDKTKAIAKVLRFYFGGERHTVEGCSPELATFLAEQLYVLMSSPSERVPSIPSEAFLPEEE